MGRGKRAIPTQYWECYVSEHNILNEFILNADQIQSKYVSTSKVTMAETGKKNVPISGGADKRTVTLTALQSLQGKMLPFQIIYSGKTKRCLPKNVGKNKHTFFFSFNKSHWSNEQETLRLINEMTVPYIDDTKEKLGLPDNQKSRLIWDAFKWAEHSTSHEKIE